MEYADLVNKIVTAEHSAQDIAREVREKQESLDADLKREIAQMRENYFARAKHRIEQVEKTETEAAESDIAEWDRKLTAAMADVEASYQKNKAQWIDALFSRIVG